MRLAAGEPGDQPVSTPRELAFTNFHTQLFTQVLGTELSGLYTYTYMPVLYQPSYLPSPLDSQTQHGAAGGLLLGTVSVVPATQNSKSSFLFVFMRLFLTGTQKWMN